MKQVDALASNAAADRVHDSLITRSSGSLLTSLWTLYALTFRQHLHGRRWIVMAILFVLPAGLAVLIRATAPQVPLVAVEFMLAFMFIPQALLPLIALVYASGIIQDEQEDQTLTYLLVRPIPRWAIYVVKLFATLTTTILLTAVFTSLTYAATYLGHGSAGADIPLRCLKAIAIHSSAVVCYCCIFGLMSLFTKRALVLGILYALFFEGLVANLPFSIRLVSVIYYTRVIAYRSLPFIVKEHGREEDIAAAAWQIDLHRDPTLMNHPQLQTCILVLAAASLICAALAAFICVRREFHVKTPEGN
jgi:ABC-2 type transport system permease protein